MKVCLRNGDVLAVVQQFPSDYFHGCLTDPPYALTDIVGGENGQYGPPRNEPRWSRTTMNRGGFQDQLWDTEIPSVAVWREILRTCCPGASILAYGHPRTHHRLIANLEDAGWRIRGVFAWLYGGGFPKAHNLALSIDKTLGVTRPVIGTRLNPTPRFRLASSGFNDPSRTTYMVTAPGSSEARRWARHSTALKPGYEPVVWASKAGSSAEANMEGIPNTKKRCFYCPRPTKQERNAGIEDSAGNQHPCVKPVALSQSLSRLILPVKSDAPRRMLVPFSGSGSEMIGACLSGWEEIVGIERNPEYVACARQRLAYWLFS